MLRVHDKQDRSQARLIFSNRFLPEKLANVNIKLVKYRLCAVFRANKYISATNYARIKSVLHVILLTL